MGLSFPAHYQLGRRPSTAAPVGSGLGSVDKPAVLSDRCGDAQGLFLADDEALEVVQHDHRPQLAQQGAQQPGQAGAGDAEGGLLEVFRTSPERQRAIADVLQQIGTQKSVPVLEEAEQATDDAALKKALKSARETIQLR